MPQKLKAIPISDSEEEEDEEVQKRIKLIREFSEIDRPPERFSGGIKISNDSELMEQSKSVSLSAAEKKKLKEVEELDRELDLKNTFSKETNRRDEDAEMNKYIDEQLRAKREAEERERAKYEATNRSTNSSKTKDESDLSEMFTLPNQTTDKIDDILLHSLSRHLASNSDEKSEAMLSSQMLNGIPEVDLGISERIRTIEATEEAKLKLASGSSSSSKDSKSSRRHNVSIPANFSCNFQNRSRREHEHKSSGNHNRDSRHHSNRQDNQGKVITQAVVNVGEEPNAVELRVAANNSERPPPRGKATDSYHLTKFKQNSRR